MAKAVSSGSSKAPPNGTRPICSRSSGITWTATLPGRRRNPPIALSDRQSATIEISVHRRDETFFLEAGFLENPARCDVVRMSEGADLGKSELLARQLHTELGQLRRIAFPPGPRGETIAHLGTPADIERIIVEPSETDDRAAPPFEHGPGAVALVPALALVSGDVTTAVAEIRELHRVAHGFGIAEKAQEPGRIGKTRPPQPQAKRLAPHLSHERGSWRGYAFIAAFTRSGSSGSWRSLAPVSARTALAMAAAAGGNPASPTPPTRAFSSARILTSTSGVSLRRSKG